MNPIVLFRNVESCESFSEKMSIPLMKTFPELGLSKAPNIFINVDFPLPEGPTTDTNSPLLTEKLTFLSDTTLPIEEIYIFERFSTFRVSVALFASA